MELYAVIMAGGIGSRFWPRSRERKPKQLLKIFGEKTMIQETIERLDGLIEKDRIFIVTNKMQKAEIKNQLPDIPAEHIIDEPFGKNTAACIGLASILVEKMSKDAVTVILPADHVIANVKEFQDTVKCAAEYADKSKGLVTIGINPTRPETGYGYIQIDDKKVEDNVYQVMTFAEKPNYATAVRFLKAGDFMWNSGMFIWRVDAILREMKEHMPELHAGLDEIKASIGTTDFDRVLSAVYGQLKSISIDYGIMEKTRNVYLVKGNFPWSDVGSWAEVYNLADKDTDGNVIVGDIFTQNTSDSYLYSPKKFAAVVGVDNVIVINTSDTLLVCHKEKAQDVKSIIDYLKMKKLTEYL